MLQHFLWLCIVLLEIMHPIRGIIRDVQGMQNPNVDRLSLIQTSPGSTSGNSFRIPVLQSFSGCNAS